MTFRKWKKEQDRKREENSVISELNNAVKTLEKRRNEYAEKAKTELKKGNNSQYNAYVALLKQVMFHLAQTKDMLSNYTVARDMREMQSLSARFVKSFNSVMKDIYKTSKSIRIASTQKVFNKALYQQSFAATQLKELLKENNSAFSSTVASLSDIPDDEVRAVLEGEIKQEEKELEATLDRLEKEFSVSAQELPKQAEGCIHADHVHKETLQIKETLQTVERNEVRVEEEKPVSLPEDIGVNYDKETRMDAETDGQTENRRFEVSGAAFRPQRLKDYIGQPQAVNAISDPIKKARLTGRQLPHVLLCGSYGQGKTTLAKIIANEMEGNFIEISAAVKPRDMLQALRNLKPNDIIFIDEIHKLSTDIVETLLYPAMEDFEVHFTEGTSVRVKTKTQKISPFTLIGATTETGRLLKPFYSKFPINITLADYDDETIAAIVKNSFCTTGIEISDGLALAVAKRSRKIPRTANAFVEGISSLAIVREAERRNLANGALKERSAVAALHIRITGDDVNSYFKNSGIDSVGLREEDRKILKIMIENFGGGPVGQESIAKAMNVAVNRVDQEYEPYLVKIGFINVRPQGRYVTDAAYRYLGLKPNGITEGGEKTNSEVKKEEATSVEEGDNLPVLECVAGEFDEKAALQLKALLSGKGIPNEKSLDELFPPVTKDYDSAATNRCVLKAPNGREIYCDSKLERRFISYLFKTGLITDVNSEALELEYTTEKMDGKRYFPDFVLKLHDGSIAVIEMKNLTSVGNHLNLDKYEALRAYAEENGFYYAEIAKDYEANRYVSAEMLKEIPVPEELKKYVYQKVEEYGICTGEDLKTFGCSDKEWTSLLLNNRTLKNIDRTGSDPKIIAAEG